MHIDPSYFLTSLIVVLIPGTGVLYTVSVGLSQGKIPSVWAALGCTLGIVPHLLATIIGISALLHTSALAFQIVKYAGVLYLLYLAAMSLKEEGSFLTLNEDEKSQKTSRLSMVRHGVLINVLNPKLTIFFLAFLPQFIESEAEGPIRLLQLTTLSLIFMVITFAVFVLYGLLADRFRIYVIGSKAVQTWIKRGIAGAFAGLGVKLAISEI